LEWTNAEVIAHGSTKEIQQPFMHKEHNEYALSATHDKAVEY
jgi:hypothetical protein